MKELTAKFEQATGHKLTIEYAGTPELIRQAASGAPFDAAFVPIEVMKSAEARAIMKNAQKEEFKHFGMNLEFLLRCKPDWRTELKGILFSKGSIVKRGEAAEKKVD